MRNENEEDLNALSNLYIELNNGKYLELCGREDFNSRILEYFMDSSIPDSIDEAYDVVDDPSWLEVEITSILKRLGEAESLIAEYF